MNEYRDKAGSIDIHCKVMATNILDNGEYMTRSFKASKNEYYKLRNWFVENDCKKVLLEATQVYWYQLYLALCGSLRVIVDNP